MKLYLVFHMTPVLTVMCFWKKGIFYNFLKIKCQCISVLWFVSVGIPGVFSSAWQPWLAQSPPKLESNENKFENRPRYQNVPLVEVPCNGPLNDDHNDDTQIHPHFTLKGLKSWLNFGSSFTGAGAEGLSSHMTSLAASGENKLDTVMIHTQRGLDERKAAEEKRKSKGKGEETATAMSVAVLASTGDDRLTKKAEEQAAKVRQFLKPKSETRALFAQ